VIQHGRVDFCTFADAFNLFRVLDNLSGGNNVTLTTIEFDFLLDGGCRFVFVFIE